MDGDTISGVQARDFVTSASGRSRSPRDRLINSCPTTLVASSSSSMRRGGHRAREAIVPLNNEA